MIRDQMGRRLPSREPDAANSPRYEAGHKVTTLNLPGTRLALADSVEKAKSGKLSIGIRDGKPDIFNA